MRRVVIAGTVLGFTVLTTAGTALAAPPEVQQRSCGADSGVFARDHGTKTCNTTTTASETGQPIRNVAFAGTQGTGIEYAAVYTRTYQLQTTPTPSQKGNGPVTSTEETTVLSSTVDEVSCTGESLVSYAVVASTTVPVAECEAYGLFPPA